MLLRLVPYYSPLSHSVTPSLPLPPFILPPTNNKPLFVLSPNCSCGLAQSRAAPAQQRAALHQLHPGGPDGAHQPRLLRGPRRLLQGAGGDQQELAERRRQGEAGGGESQCWRASRVSEGRTEGIKESHCGHVCVITGELVELKRNKAIKRMLMAIYQLKIEVILHFLLWPLFHFAAVFQSITLLFYPSYSFTSS